jgi:hypothetical protein
MNETFAKYVLTFLAFIYVLSGTAEIVLVNDGATMVFQSVEKLVPHVGMFLLGFYFSRR